MTPATSNRGQERRPEVRTMHMQHGSPHGPGRTDRGERPHGAQSRSGHGAGSSHGSTRSPEHGEKLPTKKQVVAGFVVYRRTTDGIKYLLLYRRGNYWNFPKGHFEPGERSIDTALRELEEETGIKKTELRVAPDFRAYERFFFRIGNQGIYDTVILFLAETHKAEVAIRPREHSGFGWFLYQDALNVIGKKYGDTRKVLKQANDFLRERSQRHRHQGR